MLFVVLGVVVSAVIFAAGGSGEPVSSPGYRVAAVAFGVLSVVLAAWTIALATARQVRREGVDRHHVLRRYFWLRLMHGVANVGLYFWAVLLLDWPGVVQGTWGLGRTICLDELLILLPFLATTVASWAAFYEVHRALRDVLAWLANKPATGWSRWGYVEYHFRHTIAMALVPVLIGLGAVEGLNSLAPTLSPDATALAILALMMLAFPTLLRLIWRARPLQSGPLRDRLEALQRRSGVRTRDILVWNTNGSIANAAVVGFLPRWRYVLLSDGLLANLSADEIEAVYGHEAGHVKHRHLAQRVLFVVPLWIALGWILPAWDQGFSDAGVPQDAVRWGVQITLMTGYILAVFGFLSRRLERQADLFGCYVSSCGRTDCPPHVATEVVPPAAALCPTGVRTYIEMLNKLADVNGFSRTTPSWQHFSIARRVRFLESLLENPGGVRRFERSLGRLHLALGMSIAVLIGCATWLHWSERQDRSAKTATTTMPINPPTIAPKTAPETS